jgi:hypothetical protein
MFFTVPKARLPHREAADRDLERLEPAPAFCMIIAWRVLYLTLLGHDCPEVPWNVYSPTRSGARCIIVAKAVPA